MAKGKSPAIGFYWGLLSATQFAGQRDSAVSDNDCSYSPQAQNFLLGIVVYVSIASCPIIDFKKPLRTLLARSNMFAAVVSRRLGV